MKRLFIIALLCAPLVMFGQNSQNFQGPAGNGSIVVANCATVPSGYPTTAGNRAPATVDTTGQTCINGTITGGNAAASATGSAVPANADYTGINVAGTLRGQTGLALGSTFSPTMAIVDSSGNQISSFGGGTQYTHDAALTVGTTIGTMAMGRASAAVPSDVSADNDAVLPWYLRSGAQAVQPTFGGVLGVAGSGATTTGVQRMVLATDSPTIGATGSAVVSSAVLTGVNVGGTLRAVTATNTSGSVYALDVNIVAGAGSGGTALADGGTFTAGSTSATPVSGLYEASPSTCVTGKACAVGITSTRAQKSDITTFAGAALGATNPLPIRASDGTQFIADAAVGAAVSSNPVPSGCINQTSPTTIANGQAGLMECDTSARLITVGAGTAGSAAGGVFTIQGVASMTPVATTIGLQTSGGWTNYFVQPAASDNHVVIKNGATTVGYIHVFNNSATVNYGRLYNAGTGFNGCNSATNLVYQFEIPASTSVGGVAVPMPPQGMGGFGSGLSICVTSGYATNDVTNATATAMAVNIGYN